MKAIDGRHLLALFAAAFIVRVVLFLLFQPWADETVAASIVVDDAAQYHDLAQCIVTQLSFCGDTFRTPGYPFFVSIFYAVFGPEPWPVLLAQTLVDLASMLLIVRIGQLVFNERVGVIAAALFAFDPNTMFATTTLLTETLFVFLLMMGFYAYLRAVLKLELALAVLCGTSLAAATLVRPVAAYFFVVLVVFAIAWSTRALKARLKFVAALALAFVVAIAPWLYRNYALYDTVAVSSIQGENLLFWQVSYTKAWQTGRPAEAIDAELRAEATARGYAQGGNPFENAAIAQTIAAEYIASNPMTYATRLITGIVHTFGSLGTAGIVKTLGFPPTRLPDATMFSSESEWQLIAKFFATKSTPEIVVGMLVLAVLVAQYVAFLLGALTLAKLRRFAILTLFCTAIAYFAVTGGPIGLGRFRLPATPFYLLVASVFIDYWLRGTYVARLAAVVPPLRMHLAVEGDREHRGAGADRAHSRAPAGGGEEAASNGVARGTCRGRVVQST